jgi:hypothetical protein
VTEVKHPEDGSERKRECDPLHEPGMPMHELKRRAHRERQPAGGVETAPICHGRGCNKSERHTVVSTETAYCLWKSTDRERNLKRAATSLRGAKIIETSAPEDVEAGSSNWCVRTCMPYCITSRQRRSQWYRRRNVRHIARSFSLHSMRKKKLRR